ncbi:SCO family protein [Sphingobium estronivorans]|uniref:SCO family protein n=1 Tax=Sphingobium estronivorans TaxID=1577690 RepID=UPI001239C3EE|nr:SCO family protein [Sphingobium estronivorans]
MMMIRFLLIALALLCRPAFAQGGFDPFGEARIDGRPGARIPMDAPFLDAQDRPTSLRALAAGKPVLLVPVLHHCPNICGATLAGVAQAIAGQRLRPGRDFTLVAFGIDPREGPQAARDDLAQIRDRTGVHALTGQREAVRRITEAIGYHYAWDDRIGQYAHAAASAVISPDGRLSGWLYGLAPRPAELESALRAARSGTSGSFGETILLLCYHYDPATGRYTPAIEKILRLAGVATVAAIALLLFRLKGRTA